MKEFSYLEGNPSSEGAVEVLFFSFPHSLPLLAALALAAVILGTMSACNLPSDIKWVNFEVF